MAATRQRRVMERWQRGMTQQQIAAELRLSRQTVGNVIRRALSVERYYRQVEPKRCPTCRATVVLWPCVACDVGSSSHA